MKRGKKEKTHSIYIRKERRQDINTDTIDTKKIKEY